MAMSATGSKKMEITLSLFEHDNLFSSLSLSLSLSLTHTHTEVCPLPCVWSPSSNLIQPQGAPLPTTITDHNLSLKYPHNTKRWRWVPLPGNQSNMVNFTIGPSSLGISLIWSLQFKINLNNYNFIVFN